VAGLTVIHDRFPDERVAGSDSGPGSSSGNGANPLHDYPFNRVFFETGRFNREKTVQFNRVPLSVKNRLTSKVVRGFWLVRNGITAEKYRGFLIGKN
jgi:hypothetical protein